MLYNVWESNHLGTLIQQRNIEPKKGEWALTGGYIDEGESWREAAVREAREELGLETVPEGYSILDVTSNTSKSNILIFVSHIRAIHLDEIKFTPNEEVQAVKIIHEHMELAFPTHTEMLARRFPSHLKELMPVPPPYELGATKRML
jgi:ADP-ribose pyrophosphatase YjhB (NUDIX family)